MGRILPQQAALFQRPHHQRNVALFEIAYAAMHKFRTAAAGALAEVVRLYQHYVETARSRVYRDADTRRTAADHSDVPRCIGIAALANLAHHGFALHLLLPLNRSSFWSAPRRGSSGRDAACAPLLPSLVRSGRHPFAARAILQGQPRNLPPNRPDTPRPAPWSPSREAATPARPARRPGT